MKARRPNAVLSVSPNPATFAYTHHLQDWPRWREKGYIEELIVQVYRNNLVSFRNALRDRAFQQARHHIPTGVGILSGLKDRPVPIALIQQQVQTARGMGFAGVSLFFYDTVWTVAEGETNRDRPKPCSACLLPLDSAQALTMFPGQPWPEAERGDRQRRHP